MRQAGVLAAAGLIALEKMPARLHEDHANARLIAEAVAKCAGASVDLAGVHTNIVIFSVADAAKVVAGLKAKGILASAIGATQVRVVTHFDVSREDCEVCAGVLGEMLG